MILLDTNIVMEILEKRSRFDAVLHTLQRYAQEESAVTTLTLSTVFYLFEKNKQALPVIEKHLRSHRIISVTAEDAGWAFDHYQHDDFEDALQVAAAIRSGCSHLITLDGPLSKKYAEHLTIELVR